MKHKGTLFNYVLICLVFQVVMSVLAFTCLYSKISLKIIFLVIFLEGTLLLVLGKHTKKQLVSKVTVTLAVFIFMTTLLTGTYFLNIMGDNDLEFREFQADSEILVDGAIAAAQSGITPPKYGLGWYDDQTQTWESYNANHGLQGYVFGMLGKDMEFEQAKNAMQLLCAYSTAVVITLIVMLLYKKYDFLMAGCFFVTFWLSVWVVNFARNLYWMEATWFVPMCIGLFFSTFGHKRWCAVSSYIGVFLSVLVKCLCGYEYITCVMMAMIAFPLFDLFHFAIQKEWKNVVVHLKQVVVLGVLAVMGFAAALIIHAYGRGDGHIVQGLMSIYQNDVLRRMSMNADPSMFADVYSESLQVGLFEVLKRYLYFPTDIILGLDGKVFPLLALLPVLFFVVRYIKNILDWNDVIMYLVFLFTSTSWYILAKPHSYLHTHISFVLWYFGFVQICLYLGCKYILSALHERNRT